MLLALINKFDLELEKMDVKTTFLHGNLEKRIFMAQLEGFIKSRDEENVCLLRNSLYALKQSPKQWYLRVDEFMLKNKFVHTNFDSCVYVKWVREGLGCFYLCM